MKCITLTQPWASLVAVGAKKIETRSWSTNYRGTLAIHAAKGLGPVGGMEGLKDLCQTPPFNSALLEAGIHFANDLPLGVVVATCRLAYCVPVEEVDAIYTPSGNERAFGDYSPGRFAWFLGDIIALPEPISARGALGLWEWTAPEGVAP